MLEQGNGLRPISDSTVKVLTNASHRYHSGLSLDVARYLAARGIDREVASTFRLGTVTDPIPGHERFEGMLAIPYMLNSGDVMQMRFRCIEDHEHSEHYHGKYNSVKDARPSLYNVGVLDRMDGQDLHATEGEGDAWILTKLGFPTVAVPGAHLWQPHFRSVLAGPNRIWIWGDPDDAGRELVQKITSALPTAYAVRLTLGDVGETYLKGGEDAIQAALKEAKEWSK